MSRRALWTILVLAGLLLLAVAVRLMLGPGGLEWPRGAEWGLRGRRVVSGATVGVALALGGVMLQSLLRNPLASPDLIGPAAGAGLAVTVSAYMGTIIAAGQAAAEGATQAWWAGAGGVGDAPAALVGAFAALGIVYLLSQRRGFVDPVSLVLVGVIVSIICGAAMLFVAHLMPPHVRFEVARWTVGAISEDVSGLMLGGAVVVAAAGVGLTVWLGRAMDVAALSEDEARASGVAVGGLRLTLFIASGVLTAAAVLLAGPVGFIGLVAPHVVRLVAGPAHRPLAIGAALAGAALVILADSVVRALDFGTGRMPLGVVTAMVGGPVFLVLLRREMGTTGRMG